jgi:PAS domain S-box-containing protein
MNFLDIRTVMFSQLITDAACAAVLVFLWLQNRQRFAGTFYWVVDLTFQTAAILLIILRGTVPDWISMGASNTLVIAGALLGYLGLERFVGRKSSQIHNILLFVIFLGVHFYFIFGQNNLDARTLNISAALLIVCIQCAWLMLRRAGRSRTRMTRAVGWVFVCFCLVSLTRLIVLTAHPLTTNDFFQSGLYDALALIAYQILLIMLAFSLALMVNHRLLADVKNQEEKFAKAFHSSPYAILITRISDGLILDVNQGFEEISGYLSSDVIGKTTTSLNLWVNPADRQAVTAELSAKGEVHGREFQFRVKSGGQLTCLYYGEIIAVNEERFILSSISDISARKQAQEEIARLAKFPSENPSPVLRLAKDGTILYANEASRTLLSEWGSAVGGPTPKLWRGAAAEALEKAASTIIETEIRGRMYSFALYPIAGAGYVNLYGRDETERKRAEEKLREDEARLHLALDAAKGGVWEWNLRTNENIWSEELWKVYGLEPHSCEPSYEAWLQTIHPDDRAGAAQAVQKAAHEAAELNTEWRVCDPDGTERWLISRGQPVFDAEGRAARYIGTVLDITSRKQAEEALQKTLADLERSNTDLEQFAYVASHDLQEPLRMVSSYMKLLADRYKGRLDKDADEFIAYAVDGANRMQRLIDDLLSYARVGRQGKPPVPVPADLALDRALENLQAAIQETNAEITRDPLPTVTIDDVQLSQVFQNLIANAIKFHGEQPVRIRVGSEARGAEWLFSVRDNGIGIDPQNLGRIFILFQRLNPLGKYPGTGIGLAICKKIIQWHGGRIWVESEPGKGSTFHFSLPKTGRKITADLNPGAIP